MIPPIPKGATVSSILSAFAAAGRPINLRNFPSSKWLQGMGAVQAARSVLPEAYESATILVDHTLAPLTLATECDEAWPMILDVLYKETVRNQKLWSLSVSPRVRRCQRCVDEDLHRGFAFSRALHQLPILTRCPVHRVKLEELCAECRLPFVTLKDYHDKRFVAENIASCGNCRCRSGIACRHSDNRGEEIYLKLVQSAFRGGTELSPYRRLRSMRTAVSSARSAGLDPMREYADLWGCANLMSAAARTHVTPQELQDVLLERIYPYSADLVLACACLSHHLLQKLGLDYDRRDLIAPDQPIGDSAQHKLELIGAQFGIPAKPINSIAGGSKFRSALSYAKVPARIVEFVAGRLTESELNELQPGARAPQVRGVRTPTGDALQRARLLRRKKALEVLERLPPSKASEPKLRGSALWGADPNLFRWLARNDREWQLENLPTRKTASHWRRPYAPPSLSDVLALLDSEKFANVSQLASKRRSMFRWLKAHHPQVLAERFGWRERAVSTIQYDPIAPSPAPSQREQLRESGLD